MKNRYEQAIVFPLSFETVVVAKSEEDAKKIAVSNMLEIYPMDDKFYDVKKYTVIDYPDKYKVILEGSFVWASGKRASTEEEADRLGDIEFKKDITNIQPLYNSGCFIQPSYLDHSLGA